jgi:hypothetical protein
MSNCLSFLRATASMDENRRTRWPEAKRCVSRSANEVITEQ